MRAPTALIVEPESSGTELIPSAIGLGLSVRVVDRRPLHLLPAPVRKAVEAGTAVHDRVDTRSADAVADLAAALAGRETVAAVVPGFEYAVPVVAAAAARLGLPGIDPTTAEVLRDKRKMKHALAAAGVPVARGVPISAHHGGEAACRRAADLVGFPAVLKPVNGSGSLGVRRVDDHTELLDHVQGSRLAPMDDMGLWLGESLLLESYVRGPEFSVEGYACDGVPHVVAVTQKQLGPEPHFVETGHVVDPGLARRVRTELEDVAVAAVRALGMDVGAFHLEARLTSEGPVVIEVAARLGGDHIQRLVALAHGVDLPAAMLRVLSGRPVPPPAAGESGRVAGVRFFTVPDPATLGEPRRLEELTGALDGCLEAKVTVGSDALLVPATDFRGRFGHAVFAAPDRQSLDRAFAEVDELITTAVKVERPLCIS
ncbi:phosphoribosylglycinamide synthetase [Streptomyces populi]|uniref:Phosphoribosylglycinamide synthetase n=1 Tax=Streptomyces populi TaxID=2058924 RepID=A0A2I0SHE1_9ACTN|nr:ATP-grasp domain-containing protein [Streptomyces populi]PKT69331.1 phosphoribosylglycinamide synthetase [Streptomyces populi]